MSDQHDHSSMIIQWSDEDNAYREQALRRLMQERRKRQAAQEGK